MTNPITFGQLSRLLATMGFARTTQPTHVLFEHSASDTMVVLRPYELREIMQPADLAVVRKTLDERGLMTADSFDQFLRKKPA